jgi:CelD/BcsL family acetyltransferase involved in cellulose biosynthesis
MTVSAAAVPLAVRSSRAALPDAGLTVELRRDLELPPDDDAAINALIERRPDVGLFASPAWLAGYFAEPPEGFEPALLILREGRTLRGIAAIAVKRALSCVRVRLLGGGAGSDRIDLVAARGYEAQWASAFLSWLGDTYGATGFILELLDVPGDSAVWGAIHRVAADRARHLVLEPREIHTHPYLDLTAHGSFAAGRLNTLAKHRRWLEHRGRLRIDMLEDAGEVMAAFESLVGFLHARWRGTSPSALDDPARRQFHRRVLPLLLRHGRLRMIRLSVDSRPVAVFYGLAAGTWWGYYLAGYDREWAGRIHLGQIALATAIERAAQEGATTFDFLKGPEPVKYLWPVLERVAVDASVYSRHGGPQLARAAGSARNTAVAFAKAVREFGLHISDF